MRVKSGEWRDMLIKAIPSTIVDFPITEYPRLPAGRDYRKPNTSSFVKCRRFNTQCAQIYITLSPVMNFVIYKIK